MDTLQLVFGLVVILKQNHPEFENVEFILREEKDKHTICGEFLGVLERGWHEAAETESIHSFIGLSELQDIINLYME